MWEEESSSTAPVKTKTKRRISIFQILFGIGAITLIILTVVAGYFFMRYQSAEKKLLANHPETTSQLETEQLIEKVSKLVDLPSDEDPMLVTVTDKTKVADQEFFKKAENGDKVLVYQKNKTAVLYRPSTDKVINYATGITAGQPPEQVTAAPTEEPTSEPSPTKAPVRRATATPKPATSPSPTTEATPTP